MSAVVGFAWLVAVVCAVGVLVLIYTPLCAWMLGREQARQTWHIPECADVAETQDAIDENVMVAQLDDMLTDLRDAGVL